MNDIKKMFCILSFYAIFFMVFSPSLHLIHLDTHHDQASVSQGSMKLTQKNTCPDHDTEQCAVCQIYFSKVKYMLIQLSGYIIKFPGESGFLNELADSFISSRNIPLVRLRAPPLFF